MTFGKVDYIIVFYLKKTKYRHICQGNLSFNEVRGKGHQVNDKISKSAVEFFGFLVWNLKKKRTANEYGAVDLGCHHVERPFFFLSDI